MELNEDGFLEELLSLGRETWEVAAAAAAGTTNPPEISSFFTTATTTAATSWGFDPFDTNPSSSSASSILPGSYDCFSSTSINNNNNNPTLDCTFNEFYSPFDPNFTPVTNLPDASAASFNTAATKLELDTSPPSFQQDVDYSIPIAEDEEPTGLIVDNNDHHNLEIQGRACKMEGESNNNFSPAFNMGLVERKNGNNKTKRIEGQPSKNLMAERRRRKRLNDRLSMLRSVVPKISKMDRTSILGDTIDYMKELLERINNLQEEIDISSTELDSISVFKDLKPSDTHVRNSPKFDVERRNMDTRVEICCSGKPGLLLSTVTTLETLGLEIQQCVISCFNDFSLNASCSEELEQRTLVNSEDIKQALFRNAGYGGRCL